MITSFRLLLIAVDQVLQPERLDTLFAKHAASGGGVNTPEYAEIVQLAEDMRKQLRGNIKKTNAQQYMYTRKFLDSLRYEARMPAGA